LVTLTLTHKVLKKAWRKKYADSPTEKRKDEATVANCSLLLILNCLKDSLMWLKILLLCLVCTWGSFILKAIIKAHI
jgi:hypothetical protein